MVKNFFAKQTFRQNKNLGILGLDKASVMLGNTSGSAALVKKDAPHLHMQWCQLVSTTLPTILKKSCLFLQMLSTLLRARADTLLFQEVLSRNERRGSSSMPHRTKLAFQKTYFEIFLDLQMKFMKVFIFKAKEIKD